MGAEIQCGGGGLHNLHYSGNPEEKHILCVSQLVSQ